MNDLNSNPIKTNCRSAISLKKNIKILKYFNNNHFGNVNTFFSQIDKKKNNNNILISNLLNTSKKLVKNNLSYKSYTNLPKSFRYNYPYKPTHIRCNYSANARSNSKKSLLSSYRTLNFPNKPNEINSSKKVLLEERKFKLNLKNFNFFNNNVNETIFFDFIDGYNINSDIKKKYNNYILNHPMDNDNEINIFQLFDILQNYKIDNDINVFNDKNTNKVNKFKLKNNLSVKLKITSLKLLFYKVKQNKKNNFSNKDYSFDNINNNNLKEKNKNISINTKLKFPFGFLPFFYGINNIDFLNYIISFIEYDYSKNNFNIDYKKLIKYYKYYKNNNSFFGENSYYQKLYNKNKEFYIYNWDVKNRNKTFHYIIKIVLPQIKISISFDKKTTSKFFYSIETNRILYFVKEKFELWDFYILKFFSEFKLFRQEVNRIICDKLSYEMKNNNIENRKKKFNFNKINTKLNTLLYNENSYEFFFSRNINDKKEGYLFQIQIPRIHINYQLQNYFIDKYFDLDMKRMYQINKLRKSFQIEDLIKYSMVIVDQKYKNQKKRNSSLFDNNGCLRILKRSSTFKTQNSSKRLNLKTVSSRDSIKNINNSNIFNNKTLKGKKIQSSIKNISNENFNKDIQLNLDKYIFNFDDDILKFIKPFEEEKNNNFNNDTNNKPDCILNKKKMIKDNNRNIVQVNKNKINVEIGKIKLVCTSNELKEKVYYFSEKESEYLLDNPIYIWENYIESNFEEFENVK